MKEIAKKIKDVATELAQKHGEFVLFALFLTEDLPNKWDIVVSAPWVAKNKAKALETISKAITSKLTPEEMLSLARIVFIDKDNPALDAIHRAMHVKNGLAEIQDSNFFGLQIKHAYIITSQRQTELEQSGGEGRE